MENNFLDLGTDQFEAGFSPATSLNELSSLQEVPNLESSVADDVPKQPTSNVPVDPFEAGMNKALQDYYSKADSPFTVTSYNPDLKERYAGDPSIYNETFDPYADNERVAYENWDKWDAIGAGLGRMKDSFVNAFAQSAYTWPRVAKALFTLDSQYLMPGQDELEEMARAQEKSELENPIFYAPGTEDDFLTKGFLAESLGNIGYTFGTLAEVGTEFLATSAVAGLLASTGAGAGAGAAAEAGAVARAGAKLGSLWGKLGTFFTGAAIDDATKVATLTKSGLETGGSTLAGAATTDILRTANAQANAATNGVRIGVDLWDNALKVASKVPFVGQLADATRLAKAARTAELTSNELFKIGAGGLRRSFAEWQMAAGEASIEAGGNYQQIFKHLVDEYTKENGEPPTGAELDNIKNIAMKSATADFATNVAILGITNKIQWGNIFGKFNLDSAALTRIRTAIGSDVADDLGIIGVKNAAKTKLYLKGLFGTLGLAPKIAEDFGRKQAAWEVGKSMLKGITRLEISEGLQENLQEGSNEFLVNYYSDIYKQGVADWGQNFDEAVNSQLTKRGAKTFMMGALTGIFVRPVVSTVQYAGERGGLNPNAKKHRESIKQSIETLNKVYDKGSDSILKEAVKQIKLQTMFNNGMVEGLLTKDKYQYFNNKDSALISTVLHAKRTGTMAYLTEFIKGYGDNMTNDEFKTAFGYSPEELGKSSAKEVLNDIAQSANEFTKIYDKYQNKYGLILGVEDLINDPHSRQKFSIRRAALMDAITTAAFIESKAGQSVKRSASILQNILKYGSIGNSLAGAFNTIVSPEKIDDAVLILQNEIKTLEEGEQTESTKKLIKDKKDEFTYLALIQQVMFERKQIEDPLNPGKMISTYDTRVLNAGGGMLSLMADVMTKYLSIKNKQNGITTPVLADEVLDAIKDIYDYMSLGQDHIEYVDAINMLNDPDRFSKYYENLMDARASAHARLLYDDYQQMADISEVARKWKEENKELFDELLAFSKKPSGTFKNFIKLQDIRNKLEKASQDIGREEAKAKEQEEVKAEEVKPVVETPAKPVNTRLPKPAATLFEEGQEDPAKLAEYEEYMAMRYNMTEIRDTFPFASDDVNERVVTRYYADENGNRIAFPKGVKIPVSFELYEGEETELNTPELIMEYLKLYEEQVFNVTQKKQQATAAETDAKVEAVDNEKVKLSNHVGNQVMIDGVPGTLAIVDNTYVVQTATGNVVLGEVKEDATFDQFAELSPAYESLPEEDKAIIKPNTNAVVDVQESGVVTITMDQNLETVQINGVTYTIEKNDIGLAVALTRSYKKKKGKSEKVFVERLSGNNPKNQDYIKRINQILAITAKPLSTSIDDLVEESEVLDQAITLVENAIEGEAAQRKKSDEIVAQYQLNQLINSNTSPEITAIRAKFDNPLTRNEVTRDEMLTLFMWADDLTKRIKKQWSVYLTNPVVNGFLSQLSKEYINAISEIVDTDGRTRKPSKAATKRSPSKKKRTEKLTEIIEPGKGKRGAKRVPEEAAPKKGRKRSVKQAVDSVETKAERKKTKVSKADVTVVVADKKQNIDLSAGTKAISKLSNRKVNEIKNAIKQPAVPIDINPFDTLNSKPSCET